MHVIAVRGDLDAVLGQHPADRLDPEPLLVVVDERHSTANAGRAPREERVGRQQDLVGALQLLDLTFQLLDPRRIAGHGARTPAGIDVGRLSELALSASAVSDRYVLSPSVDALGGVRLSIEPCGRLRLIVGGFLATQAAASGYVGVDRKAKKCQRSRVASSGTSSDSASVATILGL